eukprot:16312-Heterococcus_DN1.PRE.2
MERDLLMAYTTVLLLSAMRVFIAVPSNHVSTAWRLKIGCADAMGMSEVSSDACAWTMQQRCILACQTDLCTFLQDSCRKAQQLKEQAHLCSCSSSIAWTWCSRSTWGQCISSSVGCGDCVVCTSLATEQLDFLLRACTVKVVVRLLQHADATSELASTRSSH